MNDVPLTDRFLNTPEPTMEKNGFTIRRNEDISIKMGVLYDLMVLIGDLDTGWNSISTPDCVVELCRAVMKPDKVIDLTEE